MPPSDPIAETARPGDNLREPVDASDLFEHMLEAEIMGSGTYGADPDLDLIEERLSQLRQGPETPEVAEPILEIDPAQETELPREAEPQPIAATSPAPSPPRVAVRPAAPPVVVAEMRPVAPGHAATTRAATSSDAVVLEAARAAGVAPTYRQPADNPRREPVPAPRKRRTRHSGLPSFYLTVLALLAISFALFAAWRPAPNDVIALPDELAGNVVEVVPAIPALPARAVETQASLDPQITASVSDLSTATSSEFAPTTSPAGYAARRIVKLYRVDARGNILGYAPTP